MGIGIVPEAIDPSAKWAFVVGAPRCGTTSLSSYLGSHPDVCLSRPKEPHFFAMRDLRGHSLNDLRTIVKRDYLCRFFPDWRGSSVLAEGSVSYLYVPELLEPAIRLWPNSKFIICLRNPLQMVPSLHQRLVVNGDESVKKFERAWSLVPDRRAGRHVPRTCLDPRFLDYWEAGRLGAHLERFLKVIGRDRCLVSLFDDLETDPKSEYGRVLQFLGLPDDAKYDFERHAESRDCRVSWLQRLLQRPPRFAMHLVDPDDLHNPRFAESVGPVLRKVLEFRTRVLEWNEIPVKRPNIHPSVLDEMRTMYSEDVKLLSELTKRDLTHWLQSQRSVRA